VVFSVIGIRRASIILSPSTSSSIIGPQELQVSILDELPESIYPAPVAADQTNERYLPNRTSQEAPWTVQVKPKPPKIKIGVGLQTCCQNSMEPDDYPPSMTVFRSFHALRQITRYIRCKQCRPMKTLHMHYSRTLCCDRLITAQRARAVVRCRSGWFLSFHGWPVI
jgi:hypothetical protein